MRKNWLAEKPAERGRPLWGFGRMKVETLCRLWAGYREGKLERPAVQTWFAVHELLMRRCALGKGRTPGYSQAELVPLTGLSPSTLRAAIRQLERAGLLSWSKHRLTIEDGTTGTLVALTGLASMLAAVKNHRRTLPAPRHTVLLLARSRRPVALATLLGHLLRGMYYRSGECVSWGTCKASWIAQTFGVDVRNVKSARRELEQVGWLRRIESGHWHRQRYGSSFVISLGWTTRISPPRKRASMPKSPPPESDGNLPSEFNHQKRAASRATGVHGQNPKTHESPGLVHVVTMDLVDPPRLADLFQQAAKSGLVKKTSAERLQFFAAAERAKRLGSRNPAGFFLTLVRQRLWHHLSQCDEDAARRKLNRMPEFFYGTVPTTGTSNALPRNKSERKPEPTELARIRGLIERSLASVGDLPAFTTPKPVPACS